MQSAHAPTREALGPGKDSKTVNRAPRRHERAAVAASESLRQAPPTVRGPSRSPPFARHRLTWQWSAFSLPRPAGRGFFSGAYALAHRLDVAHRPHLDRTDAGPWKFLRDAHGFVQAFRLDQVEACQVF